MSKEYIWNLSDLKDIKPNNLKVFSCFSCSGGSSMGYKLAGFEVIGNNEIDKKINSIYVKNHHPKHNFNCDIREMINMKLPDELYNLDILDGSPPCSVFSMSGKREECWNKKKRFKEGQKLQKLDDLFFYFINLAQKLKSKVVVAENVKGLILGKSKGYVNEIIKAFKKANYEPQIFLLNSKFMGVPQARERVFFIAKRKDLELSKLNLKFNEKPIVYDEFKDKNFKPVNKKTKIYELWLQRNPKDMGLDDINLRLNGKESLFNNRFIHNNKVCPTLISGNKILRFDVPGTLSERDIKIIQTFPQDFNFCEGNVNYICGMSVPPIMMKKIANQIYEQIFKKTKKTGEKIE
ncbi:MAG: DNA (cytosine-5-)-methyltransferase [Candidatus Improbicoccus pseudotrichonymphae]|uniref:DNA (cytosine-5-)-methyltransferase n=1 Tax=Candidatus Improbicoccus pseudotrichonymphae TaxID=3033792 RepID=A0AA48IGR0_9FIRM|nr:MAG: DNA (cytosine-5-)-methyltransferase [Candidatus Improbicoccus pseudotrichonymphae]